MPTRNNVKPGNLKLTQAGDARIEAERLAKQQEEPQQTGGYPTGDTQKKEAEDLRQQEGVPLQKMDAEGQQQEVDTSTQGADERQSEEINR